MKYNNKKIKKIKNKIIEYHVKDTYDDTQLDRIERLRRKRDILLSRGGKYERSHKKNVGNLVNKNIDKKYNIALKVLNRISGKKKLKEEWINSIKNKNKTYEIFKNPSQKEIKELIKKCKNIRYIIDGKEKNVYIFNYELLHHEASKALNIKYDVYENKNFFGIIHGIGFKNFSKGKLIIERADIHSLLLFIKNNEDINWIWKYFEKPEWYNNIIK